MSNIASFQEKFSLHKKFILKIKKYKAYIFDFDGTLVDTMGELTKIAVEVMVQYYGISHHEAKKKYIETSGLPFCQQIEMIFPSDPKNKKAAEEFERRKLINFFQHPPFPEAYKVLEFLHKKGLYIAVSSSNMQNVVDEYIKKYNINVDFALGWRGKGFEKGYSHFEFVRKKLSIGKEEIVFVGDSLKDAEKAKNYGIDFIAKCGIFTRQDFQQNASPIAIIDDISELIQLYLIPSH